MRQPLLQFPLLLTFEPQRALTSLFLKRCLTWIFWSPRWLSQRQRELFIYSARYSRCGSQVAPKLFQDFIIFLKTFFAKIFCVRAQVSHSYQCPIYGRESRHSKQNLVGSFKHGTPLRPVLVCQWRSDWLAISTSHITQGGGCDFIERDVRISHYIGYFCCF